MNPELPFPAALVGALGYLALQLLAPLTVNFGAWTLSAWLVPLAAVMLWPRQSGVALSVVLILVIGVVVDYATGLQLGTNGIAALALWAFARPHAVDGERSGLFLWLRFAAIVFAVVGVLMLLTGGWRDPLPLLLDAVVAILAFPFVFFLLRLLRGVSGDERRELFP